MDLTKEQQLKLSNYDIIFALDKSGSMSTKDCDGQSRWKYAQEAVLALARKAEEFDEDGITVIPFASSFKVYDNVTSAKIEQIFAENEPSGSTKTDKVLKHVFDDYFANPAKPKILIVVTDGAPDNEADVVREIVEATKKMNQDEELGVLFFQIGYDAAAKKFLKMLDDELEPKGAKFDIVDTKTMDDLENMPMADFILQAIVD